jgi:CheY-like chemotaxis protein
MALLKCQLQVFGVLGFTFGVYRDTMAGKSILIVDDSPIIADRLLAMIRELHHIGSIERARDYSMALELLKNGSFDIVLLDISLPGKSGIELLRHIKASHPHSIIMMLTNQSDGYYRDICKRLGADYFMDKFNEFEDVPLLISSLC